jgi:nucleoside-diphosphate-sugar epimerase
MVRFYRKFFRHQYPGFFMWLVIVGVWLRFALVAARKIISTSEKQKTYSKRDFEPQVPAAEPGAVDAAEAGSRRELRIVAVVGATSMVGYALLPMLTQAGIKVIAFTRKPVADQEQNLGGIEWREMTSLQQEGRVEGISDWVWVAPIKALPGQLANMQRAGAKHVVALSSTSRFTKKSSSSAAERQFVEDLVAAEARLQAWAEETGATWTVLRPTLIYGLGMDKNVGVIAKFIRRFRFFPILGSANGMRQPIHARDVAAACKAALESRKAENRAYNISGAEKLTYRAMVTRIFEALSIRPRFLPIPLWMFAVGVAAVRLLPPFRTWSTAMAERMNQNLAFDSADAERDFGFAPQAFKLDAADLPPVDASK